MLVALRLSPYFRLRPNRPFQYSAPMFRVEWGQLGPKTSSSPWPVKYLGIFIDILLTLQITLLSVDTADSTMKKNAYNCCEVYLQGEILILTEVESKSRQIKSCLVGGLLI